jgi:hypothetical protein
MSELLHTSERQEQSICASPNKQVDKYLITLTGTPLQQALIAIQAASGQRCARFLKAGDKLEQDLVPVRAALKPSGDSGMHGVGETTKAAQKRKLCIVRAPDSPTAAAAQCRVSRC